MKGFFINKMRQNLLLKILSLILAVILWYLIAARGYSELSLHIPVELVNIPEGYEVMDKSVDSVKVTLLGSTKILRLLNPEELRLSVDMRKARYGTMELRLSPDDIKVPSAVRVTNIEPGTITFKIDRVVEKVVPVKLNIKSRALEKKYNFTVTPDTIRIKGPESIVKNIKGVETEPLEINPPSDRGDIKLKILLPSERLKVQVDRVSVSYSKKEG